MKLYEMEGFLRGKCIPGDLKVNETNAEYLVRKFSEAEERCAELSARLSMINGLIEAAEQANKLAQEATETLVQERNALAAENAALKYQEPTLTAMMSCLDAFYADEDVPERAMMAAYNILRKSINTAATDAFLAEVRASELDSLAGVAETMLVKFSNQLCSSDMHEVIGWLRSDYNSDDKRDPNAPLFMLGSNNPSETWGVKYMPLTGNSPVTPDGWISCSERMPAQDDWVLIYSKYGEYLAGQVQGEYVELNDGTLSWLWSALHWMPLPEPPQQ